MGTRKKKKQKPKQNNKENIVKIENITIEPSISTISNVSSIILAGATLILMLLTGWYAFSTFSMVNNMRQQYSIMEEQLDIMKQDFELSLRPWIAYYGAERVEQNEKIAYYYKMVNIGNIPANITDVEIKSLSKDGNQGKMLYQKNNTSQVLMPGEHFTYTHQLFYTLKELSMNEANIHLLIKYKSPSQSKSNYKVWYLFKINPEKDNSLNIISSGTE